MRSDHLPFFYLIIFLGGSNYFLFIRKVVRAIFEGPRTGFLGKIRDDWTSVLKRGFHCASPQMVHDD